MLGKYYEAADGTRVEFLGGIDVYTTASDKRMIGNFIYEYTKEDGETFPIVGFENHNGQTWLGDGVKPMGKMIKGYGNNGKDGTEGARYKNVFATYSHGYFCLKMRGLQMNFWGLHTRGDIMRNFHRWNTKWKMQL